MVKQNGQPTATVLAFTPGGSGISEALYSSLFLNLVGLSNLTVLTFLFKFFTYYIYILIGGILSVNEVKKLEI